MMKKSILFGALIAMFFASSCEKDPVQGKDGDGKNPDKETLFRDSAYYYSLALSLWEDKLPSPTIKNDQIDLQAYTGKFADAEAVLADLKKYATLDRFSFVDRTGDVSSEIQQGVYKETGAIPIFLLETAGATKAQMYIRLVQKGSPAADAGLMRGMKIVSVNGDKDVLLDPNGSNSQKAIQLYQKFFTGDKLVLEVVNTDGKASTITVTGTSYKMDPILTNKVLDLNGKKVGYFAYTSFINVYTGGKPNEHYNKMKAAFDGFAGVDELVIDLRYNGGGSTLSAEELSNFLVPTANAKSLMYKYKINRHLITEGLNNEGMPFGPVNFDKTNTLNLKRVYFLVTKSTASASELVINNLKPYMDVQIISTGNVGSYGKPVGFFESKVLKGYASYYITSFQMLNSKGEGDYFAGLIGTKKDAYEGFTKQLGDPTEGMLSEALYHIANGSYRSSSASASLRKTSRSGKAEMEPSNKQPLNPHGIGMYKFADEIKSLPTAF